MEKEFKIFILSEDEPRLSDTEEVELELEKMSCAVGTEDEFIVLLNDKMYAKGKFNKENYNIKDYLLKKSKSKPKVSKK